MTATLRLYQNNGPGGQPGSRFYESAPFTLNPGFNTVTLDHIELAVPDFLTWTVQFAGSASIGTVGLIIEDPPTAGSSDIVLGMKRKGFWMKRDGTWVLSQFLGLQNGPIANFGAQARVVKESSGLVNDNTGMITLTPGLIAGLASTPLRPPSWPPVDPALYKITIRPGPIRGTNFTPVVPPRIYNPITNTIDPDPYTAP